MRSYPEPDLFQLTGLLTEVAYEFTTPHKEQVEKPA